MTNPALRTLQATRYVIPLREGGSMPAIVEADDDGLYVLKFRGAGQGPKALVAEIVVGELARALGLPVPEIVLIELDAELARTEGDPEIQELIRASAGLNLGLDYLPGSVNFDPAAEQPGGELASAIVWLDAFTSNVDRSFRNTNLLVWHGAPWLIDHGAALYFHHGWDGSTDAADSRFPMVREHVLLPLADGIEAADARLAPQVTRELLEGILARVPDSWLEGDDAWGEPAAQRAAYVDFLLQRLANRRGFLEEALHARG